MAVTRPPAPPTPAAPSGDEIPIASARGAGVLILCMSVLFLHLIDRQIMAILAEPIKADLGFSDTQIGLLTGLGFSLLYSILGIPVARLADRVDRVRIIAIATGAWSAMTAVTGLTSSFGAMLVARMGVAAGEAGGIPPMHALVADLFKPEERGRAFSIVQLGGPLGVLTAFFAGGYLAAAFDWRTVFYVAGGAGVVFALVIWKLLPEPRRGRPAPDPHAASFVSAAKTLLSIPAYRQLLAGVAWAGFGLYATIIWAPSFLIRSFELPIAQVGLVLGTAFGLLGAVAVLLAGQISDAAKKRDPGAHAFVPAVMMIAAAPLAAAGFLSGTLVWAMGLLILPIMMMSAWQAPSIAAVQDTATPRTRALAAALVMFTLNLLGLGLGPLVVGILSDVLNPAFGQESLRYALLTVPVSFVLAGVHWIIAARGLRARARELEESAP
ncbi:MAG: MFS transporter [Oceanicaulis sp.]